MVATSVVGYTEEKNSSSLTLASSLALAAGLLLEPAGIEAAGFGLLDDDRWETEAAFLLYNEPDRVSAIEPVISVRRILDTDRSLTLSLVLDSLTGASGSGATAAPVAQTFTRPSGNGSYVVAPGDTPLDDTFRDSRKAVAVNWTGPLGQGSILDVGTNYSNEYDYQSTGANVTLSHGFDRNNRTLSLGLSSAYDTIEPVGGRPVPFQSMTLSRDRFDEAGFASDADGTEGLERAIAIEARQGKADKRVVDVLIGFTQVIDRSSLVQFNLGLGEVDGYQNDPYKFLSVVGADGDVMFSDTGLGLPLVAFENRPDSRSKRTFYAQYKRDFDGRVFDSAYRFGTDDWGINSHTVDFSLRMPVGRSWFEPAIRYYHQSAADFFQPFLRAEDLPDVGDRHSFASSDYRLGELDAWTVGLSYGRRDRIDWSVTLEYYLQLVREPDTDVLAGQENAPNVDALLFRIGTKF